jgi:arginine/lysine/ornithine decarboxylase
MNTPICDFVRAYRESGALRLHMPGHKGRVLLGPEPMDITEIPGADVLYHARGPIRESEENASALFGSARTLYSAEGSSLCIRAMLQLTLLHAKMHGLPLRVAAGRNAHRVFLEGAALLDLELRWIGCGASLLSCVPTLSELEALFADPESAPAAVYLTSPDYLGNCLNLAPYAELCHRHGALLLVDNAHGAYLKFLSPSRHPLDQGADLCCDSAHKTLPVLTGGAWLHLSRCCPEELLPMAEQALALFASTSPSYLILQSLDAVNPLLAGAYPSRIRETAAKADVLKASLRAAGWALSGGEPLKLCLLPKARGYTGEALAALLQEAGIVPEFSDPDHLVLMISPENTEAELQRLEAFLLSLPCLPAMQDAPPPLPAPQPVLSPREALLSPFETLPAERCLGRILATPCVGCPPAVPIAVCGERLGPEALALFGYYGIEELDLVLAETNHPES